MSDPNTEVSVVNLDRCGLCGHRCAAKYGIFEKTAGIHDAILGPEIFTRRVEQDAQWGGPSHDDSHEAEDWLGYITKQLDEASDAMSGMMGVLIYEDRMMDIAALAVAAIQSSRRKRDAGRH